MSVRGAAACWLTAGIAYSTLEAFAAAAQPGYRYAHDMISDLGRPTSPLSHLMNTGFVVQGTLFLAGAVLLTRARPFRGGGLFVGFAAANAVGNVVVATVPSGPSGIPWLHVLAAVFAIVGGNAAILAGAPAIAKGVVPQWYRGFSIVMAALGLLAFAALAVASTTSATPVLPDATWERLSVYTIIGWQVVSAGRLLVTCTGPTR